MYAFWNDINVFNNEGFIMGQYHCVYNTDKKEYLHPHRLGDGLKLLEFCESTTSKALCYLLANSNGRGGGDIRSNSDYYKGRWAGDRIVIQGDYAEKDDPAFIENEDEYGDISAGVLDEMQD